LKEIANRIRNTLQSENNPTKCWNGPCLAENKIITGIINTHVAIVVNILLVITISLVVNVAFLKSIPSLRNIDSKAQKKAAKKPSVIPISCAVLNPFEDTNPGITMNNIPARTVIPIPTQTNQGSPFLEMNFTIIKDKTG